MSATFTLYRTARDAGVPRDVVDHLTMEERMMLVETFVLQPSTYPRDNIEMAVRAVIQFHNTNPIEHQGTKKRTILVFVDGKTDCLGDILDHHVAE